MANSQERLLKRLYDFDQLDFRQKTAAEASTKLYQNRAVEIIRTNFLAFPPPRPDDQSRVSFLDLPGEIRNEVYDYIVNMKFSRTLVPRRDFTTKPCAFLGLLLTCRQLSFELRTRMEAKVTAYIPVMGSMQYGALAHEISKSGTADLFPIHTTILTAMTSFMNVRFHFHNGALLEKITLSRDGRHVRYLQDGHRNPDECGSLILWRFRQTLLLFTSSSEMVAKRYGGMSQRQATVHFDHLTIDWAYRIHFYRFNNMQFLLSRMHQDRHTNWDIRHYFFTGTELGDLAMTIPRLDDLLCTEYRRHLKSCATMENVRTAVDVYGNGKWAYDGRRDKDWITRDVMESSREWPSWPERDVPWRGGIVEPGGWDRWDVRTLG